MQYKTKCAISFKGDRVRPGTVLEIDPVTAANYGSSLVPLEPEPAPAPVEVEKSLEEMTSAELKDKAAALGLSTSGSKADVYERIKLHVEGEDVTS